MGPADWKILVVDDEEGVCSALKNYLSFSGFNVITANNGNDALAIEMAPMDGITLLEKLRALDFSIQVIIMTGYSTFDYTIQALEKGAVDYILKPFDDMEDIVRMVQLSAEKLARWKNILAHSARLQREREAKAGNH